MPIQGALPSRIDRVSCHLPSVGRIRIDIKRDDLIHPGVVGNKFRKTMPLLQAAKAQGACTVVSFGGAHSNHLSALSFAGRELGIGTIGVVRGNEYATAQTPVLEQCLENGMLLSFVSRLDYYPLQSDHETLAKLLAEHGPIAIIPEGGTAPAALKGVAAMVTELADLTRYSTIVCPVGTGGTAFGVALGLERAGAPAHVRVLATSALKGYTDLPEQGQRAVLDLGGPDLLNKLRSRIDFVGAAGGRGFGKPSPELLAFMAEWEDATAIPLDYVYTGKALHWIATEAVDLVEDGRLLFLHTGGYQTAGLQTKLGRSLVPPRYVGRLKL